ncbi:hypothetical protein NEAUS03_1801 [Nematocida ausubeli]|nr:hypothetical protein NEAUS03_1801 [Nematocida ausubeli]
MKKVMAFQKEHTIQTSKRRAPETWKETIRPYNTKEAKHDEIKRVSLETLGFLQGAAPKTKVIVRNKPLPVQSMLSYMSLCPSFIKVVYLMDVEDGVIPMEVYSKDTHTITTNTAVKKIRYASCMAQAVTEVDKSLKIRQGLFQISDQLVPIYDITRKMTVKQRLTVVNKLLAISMSLNHPVLNRNSIFIHESTCDLLYIPEKRKTTGTMEYMVGLLGLLMDTYTIMERVKIIQNLDVENKEELEGPLKIASIIYDGMRSEEWRSAYATASRYILAYLGTL